LDGFAASLSPDVVVVDHNWLVLSGDDALATNSVMISLDEFELTRHLVATSGDRLALIHDRVAFRDGDAGPAEAEGYGLYEVDERNVACRIVFLGREDREGAMAALDARAAELAEALGS
jgi:hypothetical protein